MGHGYDPGGSAANGGVQGAGGCLHQGPVGTDGGTYLRHEGGQKRSFRSTFYERHQRGKHIGQLRGFPMQRGSWCKDRLKWSVLDQREVDLREVVLPHPEAEGPESGGGTPDGPISRCLGATGSKSGSIWGFPTKWSLWCNSDLKRAALRLSHQKSQRRELVYPAQNAPFPKAPGHEGPGEISCICWASLPTSRSVSPGT